MRTRWIVLPLLLVVAGCGARPVAPSAPSGPAEDPLRGQTFLSTEVTVAGEPHTLVADTRVSLDFTDDGRLIATAGCNMMQGPVTTEGGKLVVDDLSVTMTGCDDPRHQQDDWLTGVLSDSPTWRLDGSELVVTGGDTKIVLSERSVVAPDKALTGTTWTLETIRSGDVAASTTAGAPPATMVFEADSVKVFTGCNHGSAPYTVSGDTIEFGSLTLTRMACEPDVMRQEAAVATVVAGKVTYRIEADQLTLDGPGDEGIQLRGE